MRRCKAVIHGIAAAVLIGAAIRGAADGFAAPGRAGQSAWTGTFRLVMHQDYSPDLGGGATDTITSDCTATIIRHADGTASATATYSYDEQKVSGDAQSGNQQTTTIHVPSTTASFPQWQSPPTFNLDGQGGYAILVQPPSVHHHVTFTTTAQGASPRTQEYDETSPCDPLGGEDGTGKLPGGTTVTGSKTDNLLNGTTITLEWTIEDSTLQPSGPQAKPTAQKGDSNRPTGKIKVTNNGIEATLSWFGWEISYAGDWKAAQSKPTAPPTITSPDQKVTMTLQQPPASKTPNQQSSPQSTIAQVGQSAGGVKSITFKPFTAGKLAGTIGVITLTNSPDTLLVVVLRDGQNQVVAQIRAKPNTPPVDLLQAGAALGSLQPAS